MAAIDKIYGTRAQRRELKAFLILRGKRLWTKRYFYPVNRRAERAAITNFPVTVDRWLWRHCPIPWVREALIFQYRNPDEALTGKGG